MRAFWVTSAALSVLASSIATGATAIPQLTAIQGGQAFSIAIDASGRVWTWGANGAGQLGDGTRTNRTTPVLVQDGSGAPLTNVRSVAANSQTLAVLADGTVRGWGANASGQLGDGTRVDRLRATPVAGLPSVSAVATSQNYSMALAADQTVWTWGANSDGQLGDGTGTAERLTPGRVVIDSTRAESDPERYLCGVVAIAAGINNHSVALKADGTVWTWGQNHVGQAGNGTISVVPTRIPVLAKISAAETLTGIVAIDAGNGHTLAVRNDGTVWAWGLNSNGPGDDSTQIRTRPVRVRGLTDVAEVAGSAFWSLARTTPPASSATGARRRGSCP